MLIIPSIDLMGGRCVRLLRGSFSDRKIYDRDPMEVARGYEEAGARWLHVVDLDAAGGTSHNRPLIGELCRKLSLSVEVGGGVRADDDVKELFDAGVDRLVLGTLLVKDLQQAASWIAGYGPRFIAGIDAWEGRVRISGWEGDAGLEDVELVDRLRPFSFCGIIYTSISRDGTLAGPDIKRTNRIAAYSSLSTILSGGIGSMADVASIGEQRDPRIVGVILGKSLYEGRVSLPELIRRFQESSSDEW
jgi:phosphoribosylformimino-5-aminoimidazole carboxamide ribotide isomerase